jgi:hypothetical protein
MKSHVVTFKLGQGITAKVRIVADNPGAATIEAVRRIITLPTAALLNAIVNTHTIGGGRLQKRSAT